MQLGGVINVVEAAPGKSFTTLDGVTYTTIGGEVVFENDKGEIIDLPAIKGTANTAVDDNTKNVLFWIESINHEKVRFGSMSHAIRTVAAQLNEKQVDPHLADSVLARGVELYTTLCGAAVASPIYNEFPSKTVVESVKVPTTTFKRYLGIELSIETITKLLTDLGCEVAFSESENNFTVTAPTFRPDIEIPADVVEEIARIYGYHNLPSKLMDTAIPTSKPEGTKFDFEFACKSFLAHIGWQELYTYSMVSKEIAEQSGYSETEHLKLQNPLTDDRVYLRRSLLASLTEVLDMNSEHPQLSVFEFANVYHPQREALPKEELHLTLVGQQDYQTVRGDFEALLRQFYITDVQIEETPGQILQTGKIVIPTINGVEQIGTVHLLPKNRVAFDVVISSVLPLIKSHPTYQPLPKAAPVKEDLTFTLPQRTSIGAVLREMKKASPLLSTVELKDTYKQNFTFTFVYLDPQKSLSSAEVEPIRKKIVSAITTQFKGSLVGELS
jgi:phenylalanyl-tRNA synthetase beta chain